ncbi:hypothetical protein HN873_014037 [Arachis hypogaea]
MPASGSAFLQRLVSGEVFFFFFFFFVDLHSFKPSILVWFYLVVPSAVQRLYLVLSSAIQGVRGVAGSAAGCRRATGSTVLPLVLSLGAWVLGAAGSGFCRWVLLMICVVLPLRTCVPLFSFLDLYLRSSSAAYDLVRS